MSERGYYVRWRGQRTGPFSRDELVNRYLAHQLPGLCQISADGATWQAVEELLPRLQQASFCGDGEPGDTGAVSLSGVPPVVRAAPAPSAAYNGPMKTGRFNAVFGPSGGAPSGGAPEPQSADEPATALARLSAFLVDTLCLVSFVLLVLGLLFAMIRLAGFERGATLSLLRLYALVLFAVVPWMYGVGFTTSRLGATPGKHWLGVALADEQGRPLTLGRANARFFAKGLGGLLLGLGWLPVYGGGACALHDLMCHTRVNRMASPTMR